MDDSDDEAHAKPTDEITDSGVFQTVPDGYDAVYDALPNIRVFTEIWRTNAYGGDFPDEFAHIGFVTLDEGRRLLQLLRLSTDGVLVDVACGAGGLVCGLLSRPERRSSASTLRPLASPQPGGALSAPVSRLERSSSKGPSSRPALPTALRIA